MSSDASVPDGSLHAQIGFEFMCDERDIPLEASTYAISSSRDEAKRDKEDREEESRGCVSCIFAVGRTWSPMHI